MKILKMTLGALGIMAVALLSINAVEMSNSTGEIPVEHSSDSISFVKDYNVYALPVPKTMDFAGEPVPLSNPDIYERMDRELLVNTYWQSNGLLLLKRAHKYFPIIEPILKKNGVPNDFKYLAIAESGLTQAISPAGATGFWQIMETTGKEYGMEINENVDERYDIEKSTEAACAYLKKAKAKFGSWTLAAASYNAGMYGISFQQERQEVTNYYDLLLGSETSRYIFRILALKQILSHPHAYGFNFEESDLYKQVPVKEVNVDTAVTSFPKFSKQFDINYKILKLHNPWLREDHLNNKTGKRYSIKIPKKGYYTTKS